MNTFHRTASNRPDRRARRAGPPSLSALALALASAGAFAQVAPGQLPTGATVVGGATIDVELDVMTVEQLQDRAVIRWDTFNIGRDASVRFVQGAHQIALNQILDINPSQIMGELTAGGTIFLVNPNGVLFGDSAQVRVGSLVASTLAPDHPAGFLQTDDDGYAHDRFYWDDGGDAAPVVNMGSIEASGSVVLLGGSAQNLAGGTIDVGTGLAALLAGGNAQVELVPGGPPLVRVTGPVANTGGISAGVLNGGTISAHGGTILLQGLLGAGMSSAVVNTGSLAAGSIGGGPDGTISLRAQGASGNVVAGGTIDAGAGQVNLQSTDTIDLGAALTTAVLSASARDVLQTGGHVHAAGDSTVVALGTVRLDSAGNDFMGELTVRAATASIVDSNALRLGVVQAGTLDVRSGGALDLGSGLVSGPLSARSNDGDITQRGALAVGGTTLIDAGTGDIFLANAGNDFAGAVSLTGDDVRLRDSSALQLGTIDAGSLDVGSHGALSLGTGVIIGNLGARSGGAAITQAGPVSVGGRTTVDAGRGSIRLDHIDNDFAGSVHLAGGDIAVRDRNHLRLGLVDATSLRAEATGISLGGDVTTIGDQSYGAGVFLEGDASLTAGGDVVFDSTVDGAHHLAVDAGGALGFGAAVGDGSALVGLTADAARFNAASNIQAVGDVRLHIEDGITLHGAVRGQRIDLATDGLFINNAGANALDATHSWRVYLAHPDAGHVFGQLDSANVALWNTAAFGATSALGNRYVFRHQPTLTFRSTDVTKTYGQVVDLSGAFAVSGLRGGVAGAYLADTPASVVTGAPALASNGAAADAAVAGGPYAIDIAQGSLVAGTSGYALAFESTGELTVGRASLTVTAEDASKTYGQAVTPSGHTVDGLLNDDAVTGVSLASNGSVASASVGQYVITVDGASGTGLENYDITYVDGTLTVGKAGLVIRALDGGKTYGQQGGLAGYDVEGLLNGDTVSSADLSSAGTAATAIVGAYAITVDGATGAGLGNYDITYVDGVLTVGRAGLVIRAHDAIRNLGQAIVLDGFTAEGLLNDDRVTAVDLESPGTDPLALPGHYVIVAGNATGDGLANYDIEYIDGTLEVAGTPPAGALPIGGEIVASLPADARASKPLPAPGPVAPGYRTEGEGLRLPSRARCDVLMPESEDCPQQTGR